MLYCSYLFLHYPDFHTPTFDFFVLCNSEIKIVLTYFLQLPNIFVNCLIMIFISLTIIGLNDLQSICVRKWKNKTLQEQLIHVSSTVNMPFISHLHVYISTLRLRQNDDGIVSVVFAKTNRNSLTYLVYRWDDGSLLMYCYTFL